MIRTFFTIALMVLIAAHVPQTAAEEYSFGAAVQASCTRETLQTAVDGYVADQASGDISKMSLASNVKYIENMEPIAKEKGLWNMALPIAFHRSYLDPDQGR